MRHLAALPAVTPRFATRSQVTTPNIKTLVHLIRGPDAAPVLFRKRVVRQGLGHGDLDQLGRLAEPHVVEPSDDLARLALGRREVFLV